MKCTEIRAAVLEAIIAHARAEAPLECCGLLIGAGELIEESIRTRNLRSSETRYLIDPADHFAAIRRARMRRREIAGAYHSHPRSAAVPSSIDLAEAQDGNFIYLIVSLADADAPDVRGFRFEQGHFVPMPLVRVP
jgi:proteasome lid subunit RPN8/RPN11